jgi:Domain of unknown function (DUF4129)
MIPGWNVPVPARSGAAVRAMAARILAERQFRQSEDLWQRLVAWLDAHLHVQVPSFFGGTWVPFVVIAVLVAVAAAVAFFAFRNGSLRRVRRARRTGVVVTEQDRALSAEQWRQEADRLAAEGNYREALRCRYRALVAELADRRLIDQVPGRTSGDYERAVRALVPEAAEQFSSVTRLFERCWYGHEASDAKTQVVFDEAARAVIVEVGSGRWKAVAKETGRGSGELVGLK